jgi:hypothetical protein
MNSLLNQLTLSTDLIRSMLEAGALFPEQQLRLMSASGVWQIIKVKDLMATNTQLVVDALNQSTEE